MVPRVRETRNYERFEWWPYEETGRGEEEGLEGWKGADRSWAGTKIPAVSPKTITLSPWGTSGGLGVCTVLPFKDLNWGSRPVMTAMELIQSLAPFQCFTNGCTYNMFICLLIVSGAAFAFMPPYLNKQGCKERELTVKGSCRKDRTNEPGPQNYGPPETRTPRRKQLFIQRVDIQYLSFTSSPGINTAVYFSRGSQRPSLSCAVKCCRAQTDWCSWCSSVSSIKSSTFVFGFVLRPERICRYKAHLAQGVGI